MVFKLFTDLDDGAAPPALLPALVRLAPVLVHDGDAAGQPPRRHLRRRRRGGSAAETTTRRLAGEKKKKETAVGIDAATRRAPEKLGRRYSITARTFRARKPSLSFLNTRVRVCLKNYTLKSLYSFRVF